MAEKFSRSPSNSRNRASTPKSSFRGENDENYLSNFQNHRKVGEKHYMSPTVSAASKVSVEKKILVERNENSRSPSLKTNNLEHNRSFRKSSGSTHSDHRGDSLSNNHSMRPRYLRFNPNRRREILTRIEKQVREESNGYLVLPDEEILSVKDTNDCSVQLVKENEGIKEEEDDSANNDDSEEGGEFEEKRGWSFGGVVKFLITLLACFISASSYICPMNYSTTALHQQALLDLNDGYDFIRNQTLEIIDKKMNDAGFLWERESYSELLDKLDTEANGIGESKEQVTVESAEEYEELAGNNEETEDIGGGVVEEENMAVLEYIEIGESKDCEEKEVEAVENDGSGGEIEPETDAFETMLGAQNGVVSDEMEREHSDNFGEIELSGNSITIQEKEEPQDFKGFDDMESVEESTNSVRELESKPELEDYKVDSVRAGQISLFLVAGLASISLMPLGLYLLSPKARRTSAEQDTPTLHVEDKLTTKPLTMERKVEFLAPTSRSSLIEVRQRRYDNINMPRVQLLAEVTVGGPRTSSQPLAKPTDPMSMKLLVTTSSSEPQPHESFNTDQKISKKEGGRSRKSRIDEATPVRRSSRLLSRAAIVSP